MPRKILLFFFALISWGTTLAQSNCTLRKDEDGIKVYTCNTDTSKFKSIKVECMLNTSLQRLEAFLLDFDNYVHWQFNTSESKALKKISDSVFIYYAKIDAPWPVADRDMVVRLWTNHINNQLIISATGEKNFLPEKKDLLRVPASRSKWIITEKSKNQLEVHYSIQIDPGGSVPAWLVNWVCANAPLQSFKAIKAQIKKEN